MIRSHEADSETCRLGQRGAGKEGVNKTVLPLCQCGCHDGRCRQLISEQQQQQQQALVSKTKWDLGQVRTCQVDKHIRQGWVLRVFYRTITKFDPHLACHHSRPEEGALLSVLCVRPCAKSCCSIASKFRLLWSQTSTVR